MAILWQVNLWRGSEPWQRLVTDVVRRWSERDSRKEEDENTRSTERKLPSFTDVLRGAKFQGIGSHEFHIQHVWTVESLLGYLYSTSITSQRALGSDAPGFENDLRSTLITHDPSGRYAEQATFGYLLGRRSAV